jgi:hypothetical protein
MSNAEKYRRYLLIVLAKFIYGDAITPCKKYNGFIELDDGKLSFWFNTTDNSTHMVIEGMKRAS